MEAIAPLSPWTAKDDFLFTNAVQAGASLESLAKGAVEFSRKFTILELEDRWSSILFNVGASTEASKQIIEFKLSEAIRTSKSKRAGNSKSKENDCGDGKRKIESIHRRYYALRKNMCSESLNLGNLSLQGDSYNINGSEVPSVNNIPQDPLITEDILEDDIDNSYVDDLSSLLLDSPHTAPAEVSDLPDTKEAAVPVAAYTKEAAVPEEKNSAGDGNLCEMQECKSEKQAPTLAPKYGENVKTCCAHNAQDPVIPCNDQVVFPKSASSLRVTKRMAKIPARPCKDDNPIRDAKG